MRVVMATPWLHPRGGGLERYAASMATELKRRGHSVSLLGHGELLRPIVKLSNTPLSLAVYREARRLCRGADVVNVHTPVPGTAELVAQAARREGVPYVVTYHAGNLGAPRGLLSAAARLHAATFERAMLRDASARIAVSPYVARHALGPYESVVVPPGVDTARFRGVADAVPGRVLFVGPAARAYAWKGLDVLARAVERVPGARLRVVGDGDLAEHYRLRGVEVTGRVSDQDLVREYSEASVVVLPSVTDAESFGMVLAEANACGRPVVGSDVGGIPSFVRDGENGLLVPPGDVDALAQAIARLLREPDTRARMGAAGRARVEREHRWPELAARTLAVLTGASARAPRRTSA